MIIWELFWEFLKIGLFSFGGGYGMISLVRDATLAHGWLTEDAFLDFIGVCESTPGPIAVNMATFVGATQGGVLGAAVATLGAILPAFVIMLLVAPALQRIRGHELTTSIFDGIRPMVLGLIGATGLWFAVRAVIPNIAAAVQSGAAWSLDWKAAVLLVLLLAIQPLWKKIFGKKLPTVGFIGISALLGLAFYMW